MVEKRRGQKQKTERIRKVDLARLFGFSPAYVTELLKKGIIKAAPDGLIDVEEARRDLEQNRDPRHSKRSKGMNGNAAADQSPLMRARTVRETFLAKTAQLEWERSIAKMVDAAEVESLWFEKGRTLRDMLVDLKQRLQSLVPQKNRKAVAKEIDGILERLMKRLHADSR